MDFPDWHAIYNLIQRYPQCADKGDFAGVGEVYADAQMGLPGGEKKKPAGPAAVTEWYGSTVRKFAGRNTPRTRHVVSNVVITDDGPNSAKAESYVTVFQQTDSLALQPIVCGTYFDRFEKVEGRWRLVDRIEDMELLGDLSEHLLGDSGQRLRSHVASQSRV